MYKEPFTKVANTKPVKKAPAKNTKRDTASQVESKKVGNLLAELKSILPSMDVDSRGIAMSNLVLAGELRVFRLRLDE